MRGNNKIYFVFLKAVLKFHTTFNKGLFSFTWKSSTDMKTRVLSLSYLALGTELKHQHWAGFPRLSVASESLGHQSSLCLGRCLSLSWFLRDPRAIMLLHLGSVSLPRGWSDTGTCFLDMWSMLQTCQCLRGIWIMPLTTSFSLWSALKWSGSWTR